MSASVVGACSSGAVLTAWAAVLGASPFVLAALWALPYLAQLAQPCAAWLTHVVGPKRLAVVATTVSRQALWLLALLPLLPASTARRALVAAFAAMSVAGVLGNNAWTSWVAVMVPKRLRGRYFGARNARAALVGTVAAIGIGALLDRGAASGRQARTLAWTSAAGAAAGLVCTFLMRRQHEPRGAPLRVAPPGVLAAFRERSVRSLLAFQLLWSASTGVAASLYSVHAIGALGLGVTGLAVYGTALAASRVIATPLWGRAIDRVGPRGVLVFSAMLSGIGSAIWVATGPGRAWPVAVDAVVSGVALGGIELAVFAMPLSLSAPAATPSVVGGVALVAGLAFGTASLGGGAVVSAVSADVVPETTRALFAASAMGRLFASLLAAWTA
jgi:hypothetical protein